MNIKYEKLSIVGKIWSIRELLDKGLFENDGKQVFVAIKKINDLMSDETQKTYEIEKLKEDLESIEHFVYRYSIDYFENSKDEEFVDDFKVNGNISEIWFLKGELDCLKQRAKSCLETDFDKLLIIEIERRINKIYYTDLKEKKLTGKDRRDLFKIKEEIEDVKIKYFKDLEV